MADTYKFRIDHHGSLVRPPELLDARRRRQAGEITADELRSAEDRAIAETVRTQRQLSLTVVTDGEFRREDTRSVVLAAVSGFRRADGDRWIAEDELKPHAPLAADDVAAVAAQTLIPAKATLPSPAWLAAQTYDPDLTGTPWRSARELGEALARIVRDEIERILAGGVRYIQLDNPGYATALAGRDLPGLALDDAIAVDALAVGVERAADVRLALCPSVRAAGAVDHAVAEKLFAGIPVDRWLLPYDTGAAAELDLLRAVPPDRDVCLGIVDPTRPDLEDIDAIMDRMDAAFRVRDLEDVAVSPSAGFSPVAGRHAIGTEDQKRKLIHVETIARMCWGNEL
jgi:5-methyltetrahydropteroyltriglutamate--homocysteine methyltransferase